MEHLLYKTAPETSNWLFWSAGLLRGVLVVFFIYMGTQNLTGNEKMIADFARWGYPEWFRVLTALIQILGAVLMLSPATSFYGAALLSFVLVGAIGTHLMHDPLPTALSPLVFILFTTSVGYYYRPELFR